MNPQLINFIEICLADGVISDKEREVILRKSKELGIAEDECEIIIEGMLSKLKSVGKSENSSYIKIESSYIDFDEIEFALETFKSVADEISSFVKNEKSIMNQWFQNEFKDFLKDFPFSGNKQLLMNLINIPKKSLLSNNRTSIERINSKRITEILTQEEFYGFYKCNNILFMTNKKIGEYIIEHTHRNIDNLDFFLRDRNLWVTFLWTNKGVHIVTQNGYKVSTDIFSHDSEDITKGFYSYEELINHNGDFLKYLTRFKNIVQTKYFVYQKLPVDEILNKLKLNFNPNMFLQKASELKPEKDELNTLMRINNYIERIVREYNQELGEANFKYLFDIESYFDSNTNGRIIFHSIHDRFEILDEIFEKHKNFFLYVTNLYAYRDLYLNNIILKNPVENAKILLQLEDLGVLNTKFERGLIKGIEDLTEVLKNINSTLHQINNTLIDGFTSITNQLSNSNEILKEMNQKIRYGNMISTIQAYQFYKINRNTKRLKER